jgi:hypothetical protein
MSQKANEIALLKATQSVDKAFAALTTPQENKKLAKEVGNMIIRRSRLGFGVDSSGNQRRFKKLSKSYIEQRLGQVFFFTKQTQKGPIVVPIKLGPGKVIKKKKPSKAKKPRKAKSGKKPQVKAKKRKTPRAPNLSNQTTPKKSNITATGDLLESFKYFGGKKRAIVIIPSERHEKTLFGKTNKPSTMSEIAQYLEEQGRRFFILSNAQRKGLERKLGKRILEKSREIFNT